jgi:predicted small secreted protein
MKKTLIRICSIAAIGLALTACNNDAANKTATGRRQ